MIDDEKEVYELMEALNERLPMRAYATPPLVKAVRQEGADIKVNDKCCDRGSLVAKYNRESGIRRFWTIVFRRATRRILRAEIRSHAPLCA